MEKKIKIQLFFILGIFISVFIFFKSGSADTVFIPDASTTPPLTNVHFEGVEGDQDFFPGYYSFLESLPIAPYSTPLTADLGYLTYNTDAYIITDTSGVLLSQVPTDPTVICQPQPPPPPPPPPIIPPEDLPPPGGDWGDTGGYLDTPPINIVEDINDYYGSTNFTNYTDNNGDGIPDTPVNRAAEPFSEIMYNSTRRGVGPALCPDWTTTTFDNFPDFCNNNCMPQYNNRSTPYLDPEFGLPTYMAYYPFNPSEGEQGRYNKCIETQVNCDRTVTLTTTGPIQCTLKNNNTGNTCDAPCSLKGTDLALSSCSSTGTGSAIITLKTDLNCFLYLGRAAMIRQPYSQWDQQDDPTLCEGGGVSCWCEEETTPPVEKEALYLPFKLTSPSVSSSLRTPSFLASLINPFVLAQPTGSGLPSLTDNYYLNIDDESTNPDCVPSCSITGPDEEVPLNGSAIFTLNYENMYPESQGTPDFTEAPICGDNAIVDDVTPPTCEDDGTCTFTCKNYDTPGTYDVSVQLENNFGSVECPCSVTVSGSTLPPPPPSVEKLMVFPQVCCGPSANNITFSWTYKNPDKTPETRFDFQVSSKPFPVSDDCPDCEVNRIITGLSNPDGTINQQTVLVTVLPTADTISFGKDYYFRVRVWDSNGFNSGWIVYSDENGNHKTFATEPHPWPEPQFTFSSLAPKVNENVAFTDSSLCYDQNMVPDYCKTNTNNIYIWWFGDGQSNNDVGDTSHAYSAAGTYPVTLKVCDNSLVGETAVCNNICWGCENKNNEGECGQWPGCLWVSSGCNNACSGCEGVLEGNCGTTWTGCSWTAASCNNVCSGCETLSESDCGATWLGCQKNYTCGGWANGICPGDETCCSNTPGCTWNPGSSASCGGWANGICPGDETCCSNTPGCSWDSGTSTCSGWSTGCPSSEGCCAGAGCSWNSGVGASCSGWSTGCPSSEGCCAGAGCSWNFFSCSVGTGCGAGCDACPLGCATIPAGCDAGSGCGKNCNACPSGCAILGSCEVESGCGAGCNECPSGCTLIERGCCEISHDVPVGTTPSSGQQPEWKEIPPF